MKAGRNRKLRIIEVKRLVTMTMWVKRFSQQRMALHSLAILLFGLAMLHGPSAAHAAAEEDAKASYSSAQQSIDSGQYPQALQQLRQIQRNYPGFSNIAGVKTRIAVLHEAAYVGPELSLFLNALDARDSGDAEQALALLREIVSEYPNSALVDDALYLMAYVHLMERFDYDTARAHLVELQQRVPDNAYSDAADYLNAIAYEQSGQTAQAVNEFEALRDRHTSVSLPFGYRIARGNVMSRYWFDRADRRLKILAAQRNRSSTLAKRNQVSNDELHLSVLVAGVEMNLVLTPSVLTQSAQWRDGQLRDQTPPSVGVFSGHVEGDETSWARVVVSNNDIHGVVMQNGVSNRLHTEDLIGTLDYYQPKHRAGAAIKMGGSQQELPMLLDTLPTPLEVSNDSKRTSKRAYLNRTDMRVMPMSIVIDSQYNRYYNGEALIQTINAVNVADAIYRPLGLALQLDEAVVMDGESTDPMALGPTTLESMLRNFRTFRMDQRTLFGDSALVYLFTGNPKTDITLGLAWIDTACRLDGFDVGVTTPSSFSDVLMTHELGHSLGAQHDTDTECSGINGKLMSPRISGNTDTDMSTCTQSSIIHSANRACFLDALDLSLNIRQVGDSVEIDVNNLDSSLAVNAQLIIEVDRTAVVTWPNRCEPIGPGSAECQIQNIAPKSFNTVSVPFTSSGEPKLSAQVSTFDALDPSPSNNVVALNTELPTVAPSTLVANNSSGLQNPGGFGGNTAQPNSSAAKGGSISWMWLAGLAGVLFGSAAERSNQSRFGS